MSDYDPPKEKKPTDYTGLKIGASLIPVFLLVAFFGNADMALTVWIVLGATIVAVKIRWDLRRHIWFWVTIALILALHVPLFFMVRWPQKTPTIIYVKPIGFADFFIILGAVGLVERLFSKAPSS